MAWQEPHLLGRVAEEVSASEKPAVSSQLPLRNLPVRRPPDLGQAHKRLAFSVHSCTGWCLVTSEDSPRSPAGHVRVCSGGLSLPPAPRLFLRSVY